jgi:hypothetical protein
VKPSNVTYVDQFSLPTYRTDSHALPRDSRLEKRLSVSERAQNMSNVSFNISQQSISGELHPRAKLLTLKTVLFRLSSTAIQYRPYMECVLPRTRGEEDTSSRVDKGHHRTGSHERLRVQFLTERISTGIRRGPVTGVYCPVVVCPGEQELVWTHWRGPNVSTLSVLEL